MLMLGILLTETLYVTPHNTILLCCNNVKHFSFSIKTKFEEKVLLNKYLLTVVAAWVSLGQFLSEIKIKHSNLLTYFSRL